MKLTIYTYGGEEIRASCPDDDWPNLNTGPDFLFFLLEEDPPRAAYLPKREIRMVLVDPEPKEEKP